MAQISNLYFVKEINISGNALSNDMAEYITQYEKEALIMLLGYPLYKDFIASPGDTRWARLATGHEYTVDYIDGETTVKWNGMANSDLISLLAYYVYYYYMKFHVSDTTSVGESITEKENAFSISPVAKMVSSWNNFVDLYGKVNDSIIIPSAYNFLNNFKDDETNGYDGWIFTSVDKQNILSI